MALGRCSKDLRDLTAPPLKQRASQTLSGELLAELCSLIDNASKAPALPRASEILAWSQYTNLDPAMAACLAEFRRNAFSRWDEFLAHNVPDVLVTLLKHGARFQRDSFSDNSRDYLIICRYLICGRDDCSLTEKFFAHGFPLVGGGWPLLRNAVLEGSTDYLRGLLALPQVNALFPEQPGRQCLVSMATSVTAVELLLAAGADPQYITFKSSLLVMVSHTRHYTKYIMGR
jgi:hypothetical protein